jgi:transposase
MGKSLSEDLRWRIIYCQAEGFIQKEIAKRMYVSESTVSKVCSIFKKWGCVKDPFVGSVGRRKIFTTQDMLVNNYSYVVMYYNYYLSNKG